MFSYDRYAKAATAAVGAIVLSTLSITAAVGPVQAADLKQTGWMGVATFKAPVNG